MHKLLLLLLASSLAHLSMAMEGAALSGNSPHSPRRAGNPMTLDITTLNGEEQTVAGDFADEENGIANLRDAVRVATRLENFDLFTEAQDCIDLTAGGSVTTKYGVQDGAVLSLIVKELDKVVISNSTDVVGLESANPVA